MLFEDLKAFVAVIEHQSITRAAEALFLTQSAISRRIQHLEESLGAELFDRNSRPPVPTALAQRVYEQALPLMQGARRLLDISRDDMIPSGVLRVGLTAAVVEVVLFDFVVRVRAAFPALDLKLDTEWSPGLQRKLVAGGLDAAVVLMPSPGVVPEGAAGRFLAALEIVVVQSAIRPVAGPSATIRELANKEWILNPSGCGYRAALERAMAGIGGSVRLRVDTLGTDLQLRLVSAGMGLGLVPRNLLGRVLASHNLSVVETPDLAIKLDVWLLHAGQLGNLAKAVDLLGAVASEGFESRE